MHAHHKTIPLSSLLNWLGQSNFQPYTHLRLEANLSHDSLAPGHKSVPSPSVTWSFSDSLRPPDLILRPPDQESCNTVTEKKQKLGP